MSTSTVTIYADTPIIPGRNFLVDSLADYLSAYPNTSKCTVTNFQYIRHALNLEIKIDLSQAGQEFLKVNNFNYCSITNSTTGAPTVYYFITGITPRSESTLLFTLRMDTLNTFPAVKFGEGTIIERQHEDRFAYKNDVLEWGPPTTVVWRSGDCSVTQSGVLVEIQGSLAALAGVESRLIDIEMEYTYVSGEDTLTGTVGAYQYTVNSGGQIWIYCKGVQPNGFAFDRITFKYQIWGMWHAYRRKIHLYDEGISPILYKKSEVPIPQVEGQSWNLMYRNDNNIDQNAFNETNPVTAWIVPDNPLRVKQTSGASKTYMYSLFTPGYTIIQPDQNRADPTATLSGATGLAVSFYNGATFLGTAVIAYNSNGLSGLLEYTEMVYLLIERTGNLLNASIGNRMKLGLIVTGDNVTEPNRWTIEGADRITVRNVTGNIYGYHTPTLPIRYPNTVNFYLLADTTTEEQSYSIGSISRKDPQIIKIIKLPFPPTPAIRDEAGNIGFGEQWYYDPGLKVFALVGEIPTFDYTFDTTVDSPMRVYDAFDITVDTTKKRYLKDSKFYNSSFYQTKFVYDSFAFVFELEKVNSREWAFKGTETLNLRFVTSSTFNSKFLFQFPDYVLEYSTSDFDNVLPIARNNELPIFTSQYVNYLRTAYRYDLKELDRKKTQTVINVASSLIGGTNSAYASAVEGNYGEAFTTFGHMTASVVNGVLAVERAEDSLKSKMAVLENQAVSISACDDVDLMLAYSNNQPKLVTYTVSPNMEKALSDLWHYCGYAVNTSGVPNMTSRTWFNYCKADVQIIDAENAPTWALDDIKARYMVGVTRLHKVNSSWDFKQEMENYETFS